MKITTVNEYCDRCKEELPKTIYHNIFEHNDLRIKFNRLKFSAIPFRWRKDKEITTRYISEDEKSLVLCPACAKEFVEWWELKDTNN